ncbi:hypothetical protein ABEB36_005316 [Hypothenemus hampei]|uniref:Uncharacterized protein n=1 Tax=Hypothenemus hampei TaxID=57062 RepID=A0ABD1EXU8_HYPHA
MDERKTKLRQMNICRFCFNTKEDQLTNIYLKEPKSVPLPIQIMSCVSIEVFPNDGLPQQICHDCKRQTISSYIFKSNCRRSDDAFKNFLQTGELIRPNLQKVSFQQTLKSSSDHLSKSNKPEKSLLEPTPENESTDVKRLKLDDGTEVITLCISQSDELPFHDETSQNSMESDSQGDSSDAGIQEIERELAERSQNHNLRDRVRQVETDIFPCEHCDKTFSLEQLLEMHVAAHHRQRNFQCDQCESKFFTKYDMIKHQQTHTDEKPFSCSICDKVFNRETLLRRHEVTHVDTPKYMCSHCEKVFLAKSDLNTHMRKHQKVRPFSCELCNKSFVFKQGLDRHMSSEHTGDKPYKCNYCEADFATPIRLTRHITTHAGLRPYPCKICGRTFLLSHHLTRHMRSHFTKQPERVVGRHKCDICSMSFRRKDSLINHSVIHSMVNLRCVICNTTFEDAKSVKEHITTHLQGLPFPCEKCDYSFDTEKQLIEHEVKHAEMEYEDQIEKEVISEGGIKEDDEIPPHPIDATEVEHFRIEDFDNPSVLITENKQSLSIDSAEDELSEFLKPTKLESIENRQENVQVSEDEQGGFDDSEIKPIKRVEGTKMYQRKGPIKRQIPHVQSAIVNVQTAALEDINEPSTVATKNTPEALNSLPSKMLNVKVGDKLVKVQKFIISKEEMKQMAKLGILELKKGQVIMKTPGQPILNAKIKPAEQGDIENLIFNQKQNKAKNKNNDNSHSNDSTIVDLSMDLTVD